MNRARRTPAERRAAAGKSAPKRGQRRRGAVPAAVAERATGGEAAVVEALVGLGFNRSEGRAYEALLRHGPATGYEVSQQSAIPRSAVYNVLRRLAELGAARSIPGPPERFVATPPEALVTLLDRRFSLSEQALRDAVLRVPSEPAGPDAFSVQGHERVLEEAARLVGAAEDTVVVSGWPAELRSLAAELGAARDRGVYVVIFSHAAIDRDVPGIHFSYGLDEQQVAEFWDPRLVVVVDRSSTLLGTFEAGGQHGAVLSDKAAIAEFALGHVALDITLLAQRHRCDASTVMARLLADRVGRLDELLGARPPAEIGIELRTLGASVAP